MKNRQLHRLIYHVRQNYLTLNTVVMVLALVISLGWAWGSLDVMRRNYTLQQRLYAREKEQQLAELEVRSLELEAAYHQTYEYQELAVRTRLGLGSPGEKVLIVPARDETRQTTRPAATSVAEQPSTLQQWADFLFGAGRTRDS